ncbi:hypothetical protein [uncultured Tateyamaria sp.]|uniref:hypothetical protein n=1 Tax=uncultured Tateyamaria sp. TaxID=455651 RepID=UPI002609C6A8|nr:hypothetical protein [uncultured Tateyamaria sp.]
MRHPLSLKQHMTAFRARLRAVSTRRILADLPRDVQRDIGVHPSGAPIQRRR